MWISWGLDCGFKLISSQSEYVPADIWVKEETVSKGQLITVVVELEIMVVGMFLKKQIPLCQLGGERTTRWKVKAVGIPLACLESQVRETETNTLTHLVSPTNHYLPHKIVFQRTLAWSSIHAGLLTLQAGAVSL